MMCDGLQCSQNRVLKKNKELICIQKMYLALINCTFRAEHHQLIDSYLSSLKPISFKAGLCRHSLMPWPSLRVVKTAAMLACNINGEQHRIADSLGGFSAGRAFLVLAMALALSKCLQLGSQNRACRDDKAV